MVPKSTTVLTADRAFVASCSVMGGAPGTRESDLLAPDKVVDRVDAIVLSGGSAFGLDACSGVCESLRRAGRGFYTYDRDFQQAELDEVIKTRDKEFLNRLKNLYWKGDRP